MQGTIVHDQVYSWTGNMLVGGSEGLSRGFKVFLDKYRDFTLGSR